MPAIDCTAGLAVSEGGAGAAAAATAGVLAGSTDAVAAATKVGVLSAGRAASQLRHALPSPRLAVKHTLQRHVSLSFSVVAAASPALAVGLPALVAAADGELKKKRGSSSSAVDLARNAGGVRCVIVGDDGNANWNPAAVIGAVVSLAGGTGDVAAGAGAGVGFGAAAGAGVSSASSSLS